MACPVLTAWGGYQQLPTGPGCTPFFFRLSPGPIGPMHPAAGSQPAYSHSGQRWPRPCRSQQPPTPAVASADALDASGRPIPSEMYQCCCWDLWCVACMQTGLFACTLFLCAYVQTAEWRGFPPACVSDSWLHVPQLRGLACPASLVSRWHLDGALFELLFLE
jgi:hypothetical protein